MPESNAQIVPHLPVKSPPSPMADDNIEDKQGTEERTSLQSQTPAHRSSQPLLLLAAAAIVGIAIVGGFYIHARVSKTEPASLPEYRPQSTPPSEQQTSTPTSSAVIDYKDAPKHIGKHVAVRGRIVRIATPRKTTFINFSEDWRNDPFTAVIFESDAPKFKNIADYVGKTVLISGVIKEYKGRAEIILTDPSQIRLE